MVQGEQGKHGRKIMAIGRPPSTSRTSMPGNIIFSLSLVSLWIFFSCLIYSAVMSLPAQAEDGAALVRGPCNVTAFVLCSLSLVFFHCDSFFIFKMRHCQSHRRRWCPPYILFASSSMDLPSRSAASGAVKVNRAGVLQGVSVFEESNTVSISLP